MLAIIVPIAIGPQDASDFKINANPAFSEIQIWPNHPDLLSDAMIKFHPLIILENSTNISILSIKNVPDKTQSI